MGHSLYVVALIVTVSWLCAGALAQARVGPETEPVLNCKFNQTANVSITLVNKCGASAKVRTCPSKFQQCVGYMSQPNHFVDCPERVPVDATVDLIIDEDRGYLIIDCPNWWGPGIDNWWTVEPTGSPPKWPSTYTIPAPKGL